MKSEVMIKFVCRLDGDAVDSFLSGIKDSEVHSAIAQENIKGDVLLCMFSLQPSRKETFDSDAKFDFGILYRNKTTGTRALLILNGSAENVAGAMRELFSAIKAMDGTTKMTSNGMMPDGPLAALAGDNEIKPINHINRGIRPELN